MEIKILEIGFDYAPIQNKINEPDSRKDLEDFTSRMRFTWYFRNEPILAFSESPSFTPKSS